MNSPRIETPSPQPLAVHLVNNRSNPALSPLVGWDAFADRLTAHNERDDKDGPGFIGAEFHTMRRSKGNVSAYDALTLDIEGKDPENLPPMPEDVADLMRRRNLEGVVYTSHNHLTPPELNGNKPASPRYRVVVPLSAPVPPDDMPRHVTALADALGLSPWLDPASLVVSQFFYLPSCRPGAPRFAARIHGEPWDAAAPAVLPEIMPTRGGGHRLDFTPLPPSSGERSFDAVRKAAQGQWRGVLSRLGISVPDNPKHAAPCPGCGGKDRFRFDDKDGGGSFICGQGGAGTLAGDGFALVQHVRHCSAADALALVREVLPSSGGSTRQERPANDEPEAPEEWPEPLPIPDTLPPVDPFCLDLLPQSVRPWIADIAERMQCPPDFPAVGVMVALSSVIGRKAAIRPKRYDDWTVIPNLWGVIVGRPGVMKSPALSEIMKPLTRLEIEASNAHAEAMREFTTGQKLAAMDEKASEKKAAALVAKGKHDEAKRLLLDSAADETMPPPPMRRYRVTDTSMEALGDILIDNPQGVMVYRDELSGLLQSLDREGQEGARAFYLQGYDGNQGYTFDRIMRGKCRHIDAVCLSLLGGTQPGKLQAYIREAMSGGAGDDGLLQRFGLLVWPDISSEWRNVDRWPDTPARQQAFAVFQHLDALPFAIEEETGKAVPQEYRFTPEAQDLFDAWRTDLELSLRAGGLPPALESHFSKYRKLAPALALVCALSDGEQEVSRGSLLRALSWCDYLRKHAERAYAAGSRPATQGAAALLAKIKEGKVADGFSPRNVYLKGWASLSTKEDVQAAAAMLCDLNHLQLIQHKTGPAGGRPSVSYRIHPSHQGGKKP